MTHALSDFVKQLPLLVLGLTIAAVVTVLGYFGHFSPAATLTALLTLASLTGGLSLYVLAKPNVANAAVVAHLVLAVALAIAVLMLALHNVLTGDQVSTFLAPLIGTGALAAPATALGNVTTGPMATFADFQRHAQETAAAVSALAGEVRSKIPAQPTPLAAPAPPPIAG